MIYKSHMKMLFFCGCSLKALKIFKISKILNKTDTSLQYNCNNSHKIPEEKSK